MMKRHGRAAADQSYGGVFVYNRPEQVLEQYDLEVRAVSKGRESYICDTTQGQLLLKEYKGSAERAEFLSAILGHLGGQGLLTEQVVRTKEDAPIAVVEDETKYMVLTAVSGSECDTRNRADMIAGAEKLAMLHNAAETYSETVPEFVCNDPNELQELYEKHNRELVKVRNYIRSKKKKNDFEVLFYGQYERFMEKARQVAQELSAMGQGGQSAGFVTAIITSTIFCFPKPESALSILNAFPTRYRSVIWQIICGKCMKKTTGTPDLAWISSVRMTVCAG